MYDRRLPEPRLTSWWTEQRGSEPLPVLGEAREALSAHYGVQFDTIGFNWYRDGHDSVAWHGDLRGPQLAGGHDRHRQRRRPPPVPPASAPRRAVDSATSSATATCS